MELKIKLTDYAHRNLQVDANGVFLQMLSEGIAELLEETLRIQPINVEVTYLK